MMRSTKSFTTRPGRASRAVSIVLRGAVRQALPVILLAAFAVLTLPANAHPPDDDHTHHEPKQAEGSKATASAPGDIDPEGDTDHAAHPPHGSLANVGAKLSNPTSNIWALFTEFDLTFSDGDVNAGNSKVGGSMTFQPVLPIPLYGEGADQWKMITRPTLPLIFSAPVPTFFDTFDHDTGLGDMVWPMMVSPPAGNWIVGLGPSWLFPTATKDAFGREQFGIGPAGVFGYHTKDFTVGVFPQHFFKIGSIGDQADKPDASFGEILYFAYLNLPDAWQVGFNPVITYDTKALKGNRWNVPVGLLVSKTTAIAKKPVKFQFGFEYSVVSEDLFGKRFMIKLNVIPVIQSLVKNPIFGGR